MVSAHYKRTIYSKAGKYDYYNAKTLRENGKSMKSHSNISYMVIGLFGVEVSQPCDVLSKYCDVVTLLLGCCFLHI